MSEVLTFIFPENATDEEMRAADAHIQSFLGERVQKTGGTLSFSGRQAIPKGETLAYKLIKHVAEKIGNKAEDKILDLAGIALFGKLLEKYHAKPSDDTRERLGLRTT